jgi:hypothetical protein
MYHVILLKIKKRIDGLKKNKNRLSSRQKFYVGKVEPKVDTQLNRPEVDKDEFVVINTMMIDGDLWDDPPDSDNGSVVRNEKY